MNNELPDLEKALQQSKKQFLATAKRATRELDRQRKRLRRELAQANNRAKRTRDQLRRKTTKDERERHQGEKPSMSIPWNQINLD